MRRYFLLLLIVFSLVLLLMFRPLGDRQPVPSEVRAAPSQAAGFAQLPLAFEANAGQINSAVRFRTRASGSTLFFTPAEVVIALAVGPAAEHGVERGAGPDLRAYSAANPPHAAASIPPSVIRLQWIAANPDPTLLSDHRLAGRVNYFLGNDPASWRTNLPTYQGITYRDLYPGVDLHYTGVSGHLKGTYQVAPGADPDRIRWRYHGAATVSLETTGALTVRMVETAGLTLTEQVPTAWQVVGGQHQPVEAHYVVAADHSVGFAFGSYDRTQPLIVDPILSYSTYLGGSSGDSGLGIAVDAAGNSYVTGYTSSADFSTVGPAQSTNGGGTEDVFVAKLNADGSELIYATYLGGSSSDRGLGIAVDSTGSAYITGNTASLNWPVAQPLQSTAHGSTEAFVTKLDPTGAILMYSTYLGGQSGDQGNAIAVDQSGHALVTGVTLSTDFPTANPLQPHRNGGNIDAFIVQLNAEGSALVYSTYLGGSGRDIGKSIAIDRMNSAYITGETDSVDFPTAQPLQAHNGGNTDAFIVKLNSTGNMLMYATYLGGDNFESSWSIAVDAAGNAYLAGETASANFPTVNPVQVKYRGPEHDGFVVKLNAAGTALAYATYLGGTGADIGLSIAVDKGGNAYVAGITYSADFPLAHPIQPQLGGQVDAFITQLSPSGSTLIYSTYLGGESVDWGTAVTVDSAGGLYLTGVTTSSNFPLKDPYQPASAGQQEVFILKVTDPTPSPTPPVVVPTIPLPGPASRIFPETGQTVYGVFLAYWDTHGGLAQQGYPISAVFSEVSDLDGRTYTVQYFERSVFEYHPENTGTPYEVLLAQLGAYRYRAKYGVTGAPNQQASTVNPRFFPETGQTVGGPFRTYWEQHGGLAQQGYPISNEFLEDSALDPGKSYNVQYFERAVFEYHPEYRGTPSEVLLAQLGTYRYQTKYPSK